MSQYPASTQTLLDKATQISGHGFDIVYDLNLPVSSSVRLAGKEAQLMAFLIKNATKTISTQEIFKHVWGKDKDSEVDEGYVFIYISYLRQKLKAIKADLQILGEEDGDFQLVQIAGDSHVS